jgi:hypothetical protein
MLKLTVETKNEALKSQIQNAYNEGLETSNIDSFVRSLDVNTDDNVIVGLSGSHIWISDKETGKRHAIIIL